MSYIKIFHKKQKLQKRQEFFILLIGSVSKYVSTIRNIKIEVRFGILWKIIFFIVFLIVFNVVDKHVNFYARDLYYIKKLSKIIV